MSQSFTFRVTDVNNLSVPVRRDLVEVETTRSGTASISIQNADCPITLEGKLDPEKRVIVGEYYGQGRFEMTLEEDGEPRPRPRRPTLHRRVRCEVRYNGDRTEPGCWIAEEDGCCVQEGGHKRR